MNDPHDDSNDGPDFSPLIGFALGAVVGGALALLLAPASGERTRQKLGAATRRWSRDARHTLEDARDSAGDAAARIGGDVRSAVDAGVEAFRDEAMKSEAHLTSCIGRMTDPPTSSS